MQDAVLEKNRIDNEIGVLRDSCSKAPTSEYQQPITVGANTEELGPTETRVSHACEATGGDRLHTGRTADEPSTGLPFGMHRRAWLLPSHTE